VTSTAAMTSRRVFTLAVTVAATAAAIAVGARPFDYNGSAVEALAWAVLLALAFCAVELMPLHVEWAGQAYSISLSEVPLVVGLLCFRSPWLILVRIAGSGVALAVHRRQPVIKLLFNVSAQLLEVCLALAVFAAMPGHAANDVMHAAPGVLLAAAVGSGCSALTILGALRLSIGDLRRAVLVPYAVSWTLAVAINVPCGLVLVAIGREHGLVLLPLAVVVAAVLLLCRSYAVLRHRHADLAMLYDFSRGLSQAAGTDASMERILQKARTMLRADSAGLLLVSGDGTAPVLRWTVAGGGLQADPYEPAATDWPFVRTLSQSVAMVVPRSTRDAALARFLRARGLRDAVLAPLRMDGATRGVLVVADRAGDLSTFTPDDGRLLETVAAQVSTVLENSRLLDQLTYESSHDALTGLKNRQHYLNRLRAQLNAADATLAVLLMDLDRFKEVNDTLGHHSGDLLLREIAARVQETAPAQATVARLGGDEFALLVPGLDEAAALALAAQLRAGVSRPCVVDGVTVDIEVSIGVCVAPAHGRDDSVLLKRADMAMYAAKSSGAGVEAYDRGRDAYSPRRLALASQLRKAIEDGHLEVHYQPLVATLTGQTTGLEALVRWPHPEYGVVSPTEFVPLAEQSGAIADLTVEVLRQAVAQTAFWRRSGHDLTVSVNVSMRNLLDAQTGDVITRLLRQHDMTGDALTLEITESHLMTDPTRVLPVLRRLSALGVRLSIDDFGTGYSSLAYLQQLPVDEVKIDKSFVQKMALRPGDAAIVGAIVGLARSLQLETVAEGVEDAVTLAAVKAVGCTRVQGFHLARPMTAADATLWLDRPRLPLPRRQPAPLAV
jgi:diguanylate cyclase (GGDEF)-like protein